MKDTAGNTIAAPVSWSFTTAVGRGVPVLDLERGRDTGDAIDTDTGAVEVGREVPLRRRRCSSPGCGSTRARRTPAPTSGTCGARPGTALATATFTGESASGWQQVNFSSPVAITANTTYVASYFAPIGHYSADNNVVRHRLASTTRRCTRCASGVDGANGVYRYAASAAFPNSSFQDSNYWVDVVLTTAAPRGDTTPPTVTGRHRRRATRPVWRPRWRRRRRSRRRCRRRRSAFTLTDAVRRAVAGIVGVQRGVRTRRRSRRRRRWRRRRRTRRRSAG